jgi:2-furoyl-CoA dehydrogenase large subunit
MALAARKAGRPVKWVEGRLEHLIATTSATNRVTTLSAAVEKDGTVTALAWDQLEDCGAYLARAGAGNSIPHARQHDRCLPG